MASVADKESTDTSLHLPLTFSRPHLIPPAPNPRSSAVDCLSDFGGSSWIAYGAGTLAVISPLTSPPFFRQVIELPQSVNAVSWSRSIPSLGEIAIASGSTVFFYSPVPSPSDSGSFSWNQTEKVEESYTVEAIAWTGSGDGLVVAGFDVVLWIRKKPSWELGWRSRAQVPQTIVSTTGFAQGLVATASLADVDKSQSLPGDAGNNVLVYLTDTKAGIRKLELPHPRGVLMIQWRPPSRRHSKKDPSNLRRDVLLTCSIDGTARLWSDCGSSRSKDSHSNRNTSFHVVAVIEINSSLSGILGSDIALYWAVDSGSLVSRDKSGGYSLSENDIDLHQVGTCEWLVSTGPGSSVAIWAVHCLDDMSPVRYPRVNLWKKMQLTDHELSKGGSMLIDAHVSRRSHSGPPIMCSLVQLQPNCKIVYSKLFSSIPGSGNADDEVTSDSAEERCLSCISSQVLNQDGHMRSIRKVCICPYSFRTSLSVSLDSDGVLLFWSLSSLSTFPWNLHMASNPVWNFSGRVDLKSVVSSDNEFSCLTWAPSLLDQKQFLLVGSKRQIDCFVVRIPGEPESFTSKNIFTVPFDEINHDEGPPDDIFTIPLDSSGSQNFINNCFLVFCVWKHKFQTLSWKVNLHCQTQSGSTYDCATGDLLNEGVSFDGEVYSVTVSSCSSKVFSTNQDGCQTTCFSYAMPTAVVFPVNGPCGYSSSYHIITGFSDGSVKLWKLGISESNSLSEKESPSWELVGSFISSSGYIDCVSFSSCGTRIATLSSTSQTGTSCIDIWEPVCITGGTSGFFLLEHTINLKFPVVRFSWFSIGSGQLLLGVSLEKEFRVYSQRMPDHDLVWPENSKKTCFWDCIAVTPSFYEIKDFLWGPGATPLVVYDRHLSVYIQWLFESNCRDDARRAACASNIHEKCEKTSFINLLDLAGRLGGPFPLYHPKSLVQCLYAGKWKLVQEILQHLLQSGKTGESISKIPEIHLSKYFSDVSPTDVPNSGLQWGMNSSNNFASSFQFSSNAFDYVGGMGNSNFTMTVQKPDIAVLADALNKFSEISGIEKIQILAISDLLGEISDPSRSSPYKSLDEPGRMFWVSVQFQRRYLAQKFNRSVNEQDWHVGSALIAWAFQSACKDDLLSSTLSSEPTWSEMKALGIGFWYNDVAQLRAKMEKLARMQYLKNKDPKECALLYIALNRIQVLAGLFKISRDEKDKVLFNFLGRNFQEEKNKAAALKNAYVLMGRHQLELAIAFFLLGGDVPSAVSICAKNYGDEQLALVICGLRDGNVGLLERDLISNVLLPSAIEKGDRWLASLFEWKLGNYSKAVGKFFENHGRGMADMSGTLLLHASFFDPQVGRYCAVLASKNNFKNEVGEVPALRLSKVLTALSASALNRYGLPLEALECLSSASSMEPREQIIASSGEDHKVFEEFVKCSLGATLSWISGTAVCHIMSSCKLMMASKYLSKILCGYAPFTLCNLPFGGETGCHSTISDDHIGELSRDLKTALLVFEKKFILQPSDLRDLVSLFLCNKGLLFVAFLLLRDDSLSGDYLLTDNLSAVHAHLLKTNEEICCFLSRYMVSCGFSNSTLDMGSCSEVTSDNDCTGKWYLTSLKRLLKLIKSVLKNCNLGSGGAINYPKILAILDLLEYTIEYALSWLVKDVRGLVILFKPILDMVSQGQLDLSTTVDRLNEALQWKMSENSEEISDNFYCEQNTVSIPVLTNDEKWLFTGTCLWIHLSTIVKNHFIELTDTEQHSVQLLIKTANCIRSSFLHQLAFYLTRKSLDGLDSNALVWLDPSFYQPANLKNNYNQQVDIQKLPNHGDGGSLIDLLWKMVVRPRDICTGFADEKVNCFLHSGTNSAAWKDADRISETKGNHSGSDKEINACFKNPRELIKRSGELLEAICFNSTNEQQLAAMSNKKGLLFFDWTDGQHHNDEADYLWSESDWPVNGWAGYESTPVPTCISPGIGQGSKRDTHLGLGGAATSLGTLAKPGREMTGGGAFGIPGYAGIGAASLVWGQHDEFDVFSDRPPTAENVQSCALSHHPSRPLLLVGSCNTHVYLWEFGKERALATYGVLPAVNVPPPYPLASISSVCFDTYGHRFATAALDGTVCTWQLEVGGRSNVHPIDSTLCFDNHASDVVYASASGSIVATAGYNSNNVNVVVWDTLAPPATCQASVVCHEGGARALAVFDNDTGSGSMSPFVVTGGKNGDIGLHDFRFITTGKTKSERHKSSSGHDPKLGTHHSSGNTSGMVWYLPKAHLGSITKITIIPNTSMFLTGSKDGDVKLWDAKASELVYQWPRLHDRHTFFQSNSRAFGGVVRAAVTDIQVMSHGFLTCGGDGSVKLVQLKS
ncbi:transducin family protein / WD-40 repeat family protein [Rhynchospora pubera]|uniref:Transducin family protein / WD-40 repeat family protein n=1 Tax=Rhynchospora pubera TaxID=906938 RepID=A0AAV8FZC8_9POAL|nr:transducin family protein / WD-40 repeat family protein [Rhynchospora pubera]